MGSSCRDVFKSAVLGGRSRGSWSSGLEWSNTHSVLVYNLVLFLVWRHKISKTKELMKNKI